MLTLFEPLGSLAVNPSIDVVVVRPRWPEIFGKSVPKPSPTASISSLFEVPGNRRSNEVKSRPFVEIKAIWSEVSRAVRSLLVVSTNWPELVTVTVSLTFPAVKAISPRVRFSFALKTVLVRCRVWNP